MSSDTPLDVPTRPLDVVGAVILDRGKVLCVQRGQGGHLPGTWEFPGGKIEPNETPAQALAREIREELRCEISVGAEVATTRHEYEFGPILLTTYYCSLVASTPRLVEHAQLKWLQPRDLHTLDWAPADIPTVEALQANLGGSEPRRLRVRR